MFRITASPTDEEIRAEIDRYYDVARECLSARSPSSSQPIAIKPSSRARSAYCPPLPNRTPQYAIPETLPELAKGLLSLLGVPDLLLRRSRFRRGLRR